MSRTAIKIYVSEDWLAAIDRSKGNLSRSDFVRAAIKSKLPSKEKKQLKPVEMGRPKND